MQVAACVCCIYIGSYCWFELSHLLCLKYFLNFPISCLAVVKLSQSRAAGLYFPLKDEPTVSENVTEAKNGQKLFGIQASDINEHFTIFSG